MSRMSPSSRATFPTPRHHRRPVSSTIRASRSVRRRSATPAAISLGGVLSVTGLSLGVENFDYTPGVNGGSATVGGTITFAQQSVSLFAGQSAFSTTISDPTGQSPSGLSGSYDINTQAIHFQLDQVEIQVSDLLDVTADNVAVDVTPGSFGMTVGSATVSVPKLAGFEGSVQDLAITSDGFTIGKRALGFKGTITLGNVLTISNPTATITGLSYSIQSGAQFNGDISFGLSATLNVGRVASASVSGLNVTLGLTPARLWPVSGDRQLGLVHAGKLPHAHGDKHAVDAARVQHGGDFRPRHRAVRNRDRTAQRRSAVGLGDGTGFRHRLEWPLRRAAGLWHRGLGRCGRWDRCGQRIQMADLPADPGQFAGVDLAGLQRRPVQFLD